MPRVRNLFRAFFQRDAMNREMNQEMADHLARSVERLMARGVPRGDAEAMARREFGNVAVLSEQGRDARGASWVETLRGDLRYAVRSLRHSPTFTLVAVLSLGIGIGANTGIFSLINTVVLRTLPVYKPQEIVTIGVDGGEFSFTNPLFEQLRDKVAKDLPVAASGAESFNLARGGEERLAGGEFVSGEYFGVLGVRPALGRLISRADDYRGCAPVVVVSDGFWRANMGQRSDVIGSTLALGGKAHTVIGVSQPGFSGITVGNPASLFVPVCTGESLDERSYWWLTVIARAANRRPESVGAVLAAVSRPVFEAAAPQRFEGERLKEFISQRLTASPAATGLSDVRRQYSTALLALMGMVGVVLLISCANVANLLLARGSARGREMAIRTAIGASRGRLVRQLLTECALLAGAGAALGLVLAMWTSRSLVALIGSGGMDLDVALDGRVLGFTALVALMTVLLCGFLPAWRATLVDPQSVMKSGTGRGVSARFRLGRSLVVAQCALALVVVTTAGLLVGTMNRLQRVTTGFDAEGVVLARVDLKQERQGLGENLPLQLAVLEGIRAIPGVRDASITNLTPAGRGAWNNVIATDARPAAGPRAGKEKDRLVWFNAVGPGYFRVMRTRVLQGREFESADTKSSQRVAVVNEAVVQRFFAGQSPIGKTLRTDEQGKLSDPVTVVGVVENAKYRNLREKDEPIVYIAAAQDTDGWAAPTYVVRTGMGTAATIDGIKSVAARVDSRMSLRFTTLAEQVSGSVQRERILATLSGSFGLIAFLLAMVGLYGVMAYTVARRRVEIGVRIALGAERGRVVRMVLGEVGVLTAIGIVLGGVGAYLVTPLVKQFLFGVEPNDPATVILAMAVLALGALLAGAVPARRAAALQPIEALRED